MKKEGKIRGPKVGLSPPSHLPLDYNMSFLYGNFDPSPPSSGLAKVALLMGPDGVLALHIETCFLCVC